jgi:hypothetical protein
MGRILRAGRSPCVHGAGAEIRQIQGDEAAKETYALVNRFMGVLGPQQRYRVQELLGCDIRTPRREDV